MPRKHKTKGRGAKNVGARFNIGALSAVSLYTIPSGTTIDANTAILGGSVTFGGGISATTGNFTGNVAIGGQADITGELTSGGSIQATGTVTAARFYTAGKARTGEIITTGAISAAKGSLISGTTYWTRSSGTTIDKGRILTDGFLKTGTHFTSGGTGSFTSTVSAPVIYSSTTIAGSVITAGVTLASTGVITSGATISGTTFVTTISGTTINTKGIYADGIVNITGGLTSGGTGAFTSSVSAPTFYNTTKSAQVPSYIGTNGVLMASGITLTKAAGEQVFDAGAAINAAHFNILGFTTFTNFIVNIGRGDTGDSESASPYTAQVYVNGSAATVYTYAQNAGGGGAITAAAACTLHYFAIGT